MTSRCYKLSAYRKQAENTNTVNRWGCPPPVQSKTLVKSALYTLKILREQGHVIRQYSPRASILNLKENKAPLKTNKQKN